MNATGSALPKRRPWALVLVCLALMAAAGCGPWPARVAENIALVRLDPDKAPFFTDGFDYDRLQQAVAMSLEYYRRLPADRTIAVGPDTYTVAHMIRTLEVFSQWIAARPPAAVLDRWIRRHFRIYAAVGRDRRGQVLFTGYYEPELRGSRVPTERYTVPLHSRPTDLLTIELGLFADDLAGRRLVGRVDGDRVVPYFERRQIRQRDDMQQVAPPVAWIESPVDRFFLQIQGSGKIYLDDGGSFHVHYAGSNGRPYRSIGRLLIDSGAIEPEAMSMQAIRAYFKAHPDKAQQVMDHNPSYVFFDIEPRGALGSLNVPLTPTRSVATDRRLFPPGALLYIQCPIAELAADRSIARWRPYGGFALNQDTGGAIRGPGRADLFWGPGPYAAIVAGHLQHPGRLYVLVLDPAFPSGP